MAASTAVTIPRGALSWAFVLLTGTGTIGGESAPLGVPLSGGNLAANLVVTTGADSTAFALYEATA
jgi:hypothetical protein